MSSTCMVIQMPTPSRICRLLATVAALTVFSAWTAGASAAIPWHPDLATARRAAEISQRPVLAIFTASWSSATTTLDRTTLASDEAVALIGACFEPVCVDVDANPEATRRLGITKVPTACILNSDEQLLTKFELPETPAGFVAAAARGAQEAALASAMATRSSSHGTTTEPAVSLREFADISGSGSALPTFGSENGKGLRAATTADVRGTVPPGGKAINAVAAKVRMLSDFASDDGVPASGSESAIAASFRESTISPPTAPLAAPAVIPSTASAPTAAAVSTPDPTAVEMASMPIETPATLAGSSALSSSVAQAPLTIEPTPTTTTAPSHSTAGAAPWLGLPQQNQPSTPSTPAAAAAIAASPTAGPAASAQTSGSQAFGSQAAGSQSLADAKNSVAQQSQAVQNPATPAQPNAEASATALAETKPQKPSATSALLSALQKPFSLFSKPAAPKPAPSSTSTVASTLPQTAATPVEPDTYGSMPVGLEGYCPVTLAERGVWVEGRAQWGVRHRGRTYLFATAEQQKAFLADPDRYSPALSGDDPVMAFDTGKSTPGQRRYGVTYQSRTYLFASTETRDAFAANPQRYTSGAMVAEHRTPASGPIVR
jgi:YHS domain-containing protein